VLIATAGLALWSALARRKNQGEDLLGRLGGREIIGSPLGLLDVFLVFFGV